jgi:hypothetical protein
MIEYFAGQYLMNTEKLSPEKHIEILGWMKIPNNEVNLVETANSLSPQQSAFIQLIQHALDAKLSELTDEYDDNASAISTLKVLTQHTMNTAFFGKLIRENILTPEELTPVLGQMRNYYEFNKPKISDNLKKDVNAILSMFVSTDDYYADEYAKIALKYIMRFAGTKMKLDESKSVFSYSAERMMLQKITTYTSDDNLERRYFIGFCGDKKVLQDFNDGLTGTTVKDTPDSLRFAALANMINCITTVFKSIKGYGEIEPESIYKYSTIFATENCFVIPIVFDEMKLSLVVGYGQRPNFAVIQHNV